MFASEKLCVKECLHGHWTLSLRNLLKHPVSVRKEQRSQNASDGKGGHNSSHGFPFLKA
jgi:hypothetical protein